MRREEERCYLPPRPTTALHFGEGTWATMAPKVALGRKTPSATDTAPEVSVCTVLPVP